MTLKTEPMDNTQKLRYIAGYLVIKSPALYRMQVLLCEMLIRAIAPDKPDLESSSDMLTGERDHLWLFEDALGSLKTQAVSTDQQRLADRLLAEVDYYREALEKNLCLIHELQRSGRA